MKCDFITKMGTWRGVADAARTTINQEAGEKEPTDRWKRRMVMCEHSPLRKLHYNWKWRGLPYWVSVHFVRHKIGIEHWIGTQRDDRTDADISRSDAPQGTPVIHECDADAQAIVNISRKRLCTGASPETREAWKKVLDEIEKVDPMLRKGCVPECVYRNGLCPEFKSCGFNKTPEFEKQLKAYIEGFEDQINEKTLIK